MSSLHAAGKVLLVIDICVGSPTSLAQHAHAHFHPSTTLLPSRDFPIQALLFPNFTSISFFIPPINTVFYLIERIIQYFILLNDCDKEQKKESLCSFNPDMSFLVISFYNWLVGLQRWLLMGTTRVYIIIVIINNYICMEKYFRATLLVVTLTLNVNVHAVV